MLSDVIFGSDYPLLLLRAIDEFLDNYNELQKNKKDKAIDIKEINKLNQKFEQLLQDNEESIKKLLVYYDMIKNNPEYNLLRQKITDMVPAEFDKSKTSWNLDFATNLVTVIEQA